MWNLNAISFVKLLYILIGLSCVTVFDCSVASGIPHHTYKRPTRVTLLGKDEERPYSMNRGEERRSDAPALHMFREIENRRAS